MFKRQLEAVDYLQQQGFKISKSKFNRDFQEGRVPCTSEKCFHAHDLLVYATQAVRETAPKLEEATDPQRDNTSTRRYPYKEPVPETIVKPRKNIYDSVATVTFAGQVFCLTGIFALGDRKRCEEQTIMRGGIIHAHPRTNDCYLVVGSVASPDWSHGNYGTKIETALSYKKKGGTIRIISEDVWAAYAAGNGVYISFAVAQGVYAGHTCGNPHGFSEAFWVNKIAAQIILGQGLVG